MSRDIFALALHGGAGVEAVRNYDRAEHEMAQLVLLGEGRLRAGRAALDVVVDLVSDMEASGLFVAGRGSGRHSLGKVELDASVMEGSQRRCGAVAALQGVRSPIQAAHAVMTSSDHVLLAGDGACRFARAQGLERIDGLDDWLTTPDGFDPADTRSHGTVGAVALDRSGRLAAATSTGGLYDALPGRVGDSAVIGAGTWADERAAISCTGEGEAFIRCGAAHALALRVKGGQRPASAAEEVLGEVALCGGDGGVIMVCADGSVTMAFNTAGMNRASVSSLQPARVGAVGGAMRLVERCSRTSQEMCDAA